jgi:hypothetical protein
MPGSPNDAAVVAGEKVDGIFRRLLAENAVRHRIVNQQNPTFGPVDLRRHPLLQRYGGLADGRRDWHSDSGTPICQYTA